MSEHSSPARMRLEGVVLLDGVPHRLARGAAGVVLRGPGPDPVTLLLSDAAVLELHRGGRLRLAEPEAGRGRR